MRKTGMRVSKKGLPIADKRGFTYILAMVMVVVIGISLSMAGRYWETVMRREREEELLFRGDQIRRGLEAYYQWTAKKHGGQGIYPETLEELLKSKFSGKPMRFLRKIYADPMTGKADWVLITDPSKRILGVRSSSEDEPIKTSRFPDRYKEFEGKTKYSEWVFARTVPGQPQQGAKRP